ncbi:MAG: M15 family metallopeptidase [Polyangiaceae bacterium]
MTRGAWFGLGAAVLVAVIVLDVWFMLRKSGSAAPTALAKEAATAAAPSPGAAAGSATASDIDFETDAATASLPLAPAPAAASADELFQDEQPEAPRPAPAPTPGAGSVRDAVSRGCSTSSVDGLSRQIIAQSRCIDAKAFVRVPTRPNLDVGSNVFLYMQADAREHFLRALAKRPKQKLKVNSALRTVAQQYLLRRWASDRRCGIKLASLPGESNHETGLALDIAEPGTWRKTLESEQFRWLGAIDRVHFDYTGPGAQSRANVDVKAFQQLWNLNHADDLLKVTGQYDSATEARLERSPARGFPKGAQCGR